MTKIEKLYQEKISGQVDKDAVIKIVNDAKLTKTELTKILKLVNPEFLTQNKITKNDFKTK